MLFYSINTGVRTISPKENCPLGVRVRVRVRVRIRVGGGAIFFADFRDLQ